MGTALGPDGARLGGPGAGVRMNDDRLRAFVDGEYRQVVATVELVCGSLGTAEDAVQEALAPRLGAGSQGRVRSSGSRPGSRPSRSTWPEPDAPLARRPPRGRLVPTTPRPDAPGASAEAHAVREALRALPRRQREVTVLRYYLGLDVRGDRRMARHRRGHGEGDAVPRPAVARRRPPGGRPPTTELDEPLTDDLACDGLRTVRRNEPCR